MCSIREQMQHIKTSITEFQKPVFSKYDQSQNFI